MIVKPKRNTRLQVLTAVTYRTPMSITELSIRCNGDGSYVCPRCHTTLEREFSAYCDRCGQCLNWSQYKQARHIYAR